MEMSKLEKVTKGLERCKLYNKVNCDECPYDYNGRGNGKSECTAELADDALALLKEQEATWVGYPECLKYENAYSTDHIVCSACRYVFSTIDNCTEEFMHCPHCGAKMI